MKNKFLENPRVILFVLFLCIMTLFGSKQAFSETKYWTGGDGLWSEDLRWSPGGVPAPGDEVYITGYSNITFDWHYSDYLNRLVLDDSVLNIPSNGYTLRVGPSYGGGGIVIGDWGITGSLVQDGGSVFIRGGYGALNLGNNPGSYGTYTLNAGELVLEEMEEYIGNSGIGVFTQKGGTHTFTGGMYIGNSGYGEYYLYDGVLQASSSGGGIVLGEWGGQGYFYQYGGSVTADMLTLGRQPGASGYYYQYGGSVNVGYLTLGNAPYASGYYELQDGTLSVAFDERIGNAEDSFGRFSQYGGNHAVYGSLFIDSVPYSKGYYVLSGGNLEVYGNTIVGSFGSGNFYQYGGTHNTYGDLNLGEQPGSSGYYELSGGTLFVGGAERIGVNGSGTFLQYYGSHTVNGALVLANESESYGSYVLDDGELKTGETFVGMNGKGFFSQFGGIHSTVNDLNIAQEPGSFGFYYLDAGQLNVGRHLHIGISGEGYLYQDGGTLKVGSDLVLGNEKDGYGQLDIEGGELIVQKNAFVGMAGEGRAYQWGGSVTILGPGYDGSLVLAAEKDSFGLYSITDGELSANFIQVGASGTGEFYQEGGKVTVKMYEPYNPSAPGGGINLGQVLGSKGTYTITGGELIAQDILVGASGEGTFNQEGGTVTIKGGLVLAGDVVGTALGTYNLKGGTLTTGNTQVGAWGTGIFNQDGGTKTTDLLVIGGAYDPGTGVKGKGTYNLVSGDLVVNTNTVVGWSGEGIFRQKGGTHTVKGELIISMDAPQSSGIYEMSGGKLVAGKIVNKDTFIFDGGHIITSLLSNYGLFTGAGGIFEGSFTNIGTLSPGSSPGILNITGNYIQDPLGTLILELAGYLKGTEYDFLNITGTATLNGTLKLVLLSGFIPAAGSDFFLIHADSGISGQFSFLELPDLGAGKAFKIVYLSNDVYAHVTPVPSTILLLGSGLLGVVVVMRRRLKK